MSRKMEQKNPGIKRPFFPLPNNEEIENYTCVTLSIPDTQDYRVSLLSALLMLTQWFSWERNGTDDGKITADIWREIVDNMAWSNACCDEKPTRSRLTEDSIYEVSYDNGETWTPAPELDPRKTSLEFPPLPEIVGGSGTCAAAENVTQNLIDQLQQNIDELNLGAGIVGIVAGILGIAAIFMSGGALTPIVVGLAGTLFAAGGAAIESAFTSGVWETFKCIVYCNTSNSGEFTRENIDAIYAKIGEELTGIAASILQQYVYTYGEIGLTNLARTGTGTGESCDECDPCSPYPDLVAFDDFGVVTNEGGGFFLIEMVYDFVFDRDVMMSNIQDSSLRCWKYTSLEIVEGRVDRSNFGLDCTGSFSPYLGINAPLQRWNNDNWPDTTNFPCVYRIQAELV